MKGHLDALKAFSDDERCKASRYQAVSQSFYDYIRDEVNRLHDDGQELMGPAAEAVTMLDAYLAPPAVPQPGAAAQWKQMTRFSWLPSVVALVTALAALLTAVSTYRQVDLLGNQVAYQSAETRPFFRLRPRILSSSKASMLLSMNIVNVGRVPGRVLGYDMLVQLGRDTISPKEGAASTMVDVLYPTEPGVGITAQLSAGETQRWARGERLIIGGCLIYGGLQSDDTRRWKVFGAYSFGVGDELPTGLFMDEEALASDTRPCNASGLREEWQKRLRSVPQNAG
jgi:hypothetical protein